MRRSGGSSVPWWKRAQTNIDESARLRESFARIQREIVDAALGEYAAFLAEEYDETDWRVVWDESKAGRTGYALSEIPQMRAKSRDLYFYRSGHARRIVDNAKNYVIGNGMTFVPVCEDKDAAATIADYWRTWTLANDWVARQREIVERGWLDGEIFLHYLRKGDELRLRFLEPEDIRDPVDVNANGIDTASDDIEEVLRYSWCKVESTSTDDRTWLDAEDVEHIIWFGSKTIGRGIPPLIPSVNRLKQYEGWLQARLLLNKVRAAIVLVRKHEGATEAQIKAFVAKWRSGTEYRESTGKDENKKKLQLATVMDIPAKQTVEMLSPNLQAADAQHDGRNLLLAIASAVGQSEVMLSADASNANFASTWIAEAPPVKDFAAQQGKLILPFERIWQRVMQHGQRLGALADSLDIGVQITPPTLVGRKRLDEVKADAVLSDHEVISKKTWRGREGLDHDQEEANLEAQAETDAGLRHGLDGNEATSSTTTSMSGDPWSGR